MQKVLILGVNGFVGRYLVKEFLEHGYSVFGSDIAENTSLKDIGYQNADILNELEITQLITQTNPDMIINLAAVSSVGQSWNNPQLTMKVNVVGSLNILEAARKLKKLPKILLVGSSEEYMTCDEPINENMPLNANNPYGISKIAQENIAKMYRNFYNMMIYCVRAFNHTGVGQNNTFVIPSFCKQAAEIENSGQSGIIKVGNLSAKRDFCDVNDVVRAYRMIIESDDCSKIYNIGSGTVYSLQEILDYIVSLCSQKITVEVDYKRYRPVDTPIVRCDNRLIRKELGWIPNISVKKTIKNMFEFYRNM